MTLVFLQPQRILVLLLNCCNLACHQTTALAAANAGHLGVLRVLLAEGADVDATNTGYRSLSIIWAAQIIERGL